MNVVALTAIVSLASGLLGSLCGSYFSVLAVNRSRYLESKSKFRSILIELRLFARLSGEEAFNIRLRGDYLQLYQAYQDVLSASFLHWKFRNKLKLAWSSFKGDCEDDMPLWGTSVVTKKGNGASCSVRAFTREEMICKIDQLSKVLC